MSSILRISAAISAVALLALGVAPRANAGGPTTAQQITLSLKTIDQTTNNSGDDKPDRHTANTNDVFEACTNSTNPPTKTQGIYLFLNCTDLIIPVDPTIGTILAIETNPLSRLADVGTVSIDTGLLVSTTKSHGAVRTQAIAPVTVNIDCNVHATTATLHGVMTMRFSEVGTSGSICPDSGMIKLLGDGVTPMPGDFIVDSGSQIVIKKRSASIATIPPP